MATPVENPLVRFVTFGAVIPFLPDPLHMVGVAIVALLIIMVIVGYVLEKFMAKPAFTLKDVPSLKGKIAVITGGHSGIGYESALALAKRGAKVIIASRSDREGEAAVESIKDVLNAEAHEAGVSTSGVTWPVEYRNLDLGSLASVRKFVKAYGEGPLHILINAAEVSMCPFSLTDDGFERQIGVNHLGHFCLTALLAPSLKAAGAASSSRVVFVTNRNHENSYPGGVDFGSLRSRAGYNPALAYGQSKLCNILVAYKFAKRLGHCGVLVNAVHPGSVDLNVQIKDNSGDYSNWGPFAPLLRVMRATGPFATIGVGEASLSVIWAATAMDVSTNNITGKYIVPQGQQGVPSRFARDQQLAKRVWDWSVEACQLESLPEPLREKFAVQESTTVAEARKVPQKIAVDSTVDAEEVNKVFVWMGVSPSLQSTCGESLYTSFPGALPGSAITKRVAAILRDYGLTPENTIYGQSICSDEINNEKGDLANLMADYWGELFPLGGIGGAPYAGKTGFGAFSHHVPDGGNVVVLYGPHIGVASEGELGKYMRIGQSCNSDACGAIVAAYKQCCQECKEEETKASARNKNPFSALGATPAGLGQRKASHHEHDMQQSWLRSKVRPALPRIKEAKTPIVELTHTVYDAINDMMHSIINHGFGTGKLVLIGGIQINLQAPYEDHFLPLTFEVSSKDTSPVDLLPKLHMKAMREVAAAAAAAAASTKAE